MDAMVLNAAHAPLELAARRHSGPGAAPAAGEIDACGVCRTDLHVIDGELPHARSPVIPGHEIVGTVVDAGAAVDSFRARRPCRHSVARLDLRCLRLLPGGPREPLRQRAVHRLHGRRRIRGVRRRRSPLLFSAAGRRSSGRARAVVMRGAHRLPRAPRGGRGARLGIYGFGAAAHIVAQLARHQGQEVFAFTRPGDAQAQEFARTLGAVWAGEAMWRRRRARRVDHVRSRRRAGAGCIAQRGEGRNGRLRGHPHERHSAIPVRHPVGRAHCSFGGEPHAARRHRIHRARIQGSDPDQHRRISAASGKRSAACAAHRRHQRRRGADDRLIARR